ncbi:MAG: bifunctional transaldolase/phosoglucose isomerase [Acidobacteriota bacterium]|nr:MAG: bifunctional transaldolase/phosoglucose isomerase [Acidobacteriota bacterium]
MALNSFSYFLPDQIEGGFRRTAAQWQVDDKIAGIWQRDASVWTGSGEENWLGWLDIVERELADLQKYRSLHEDIETAGFEHILLLGMGGSSLCPEVLANTFGKAHFHILDSTVPAQVKAVENKISLEKTLFIVASKSGSTLEPNCFKQYFFDRVSQSSTEPGKHFVAITDPGSRMEQVALDDGFRHIIYGEPTVGGRFSALSPFGMAAAAAMGLNVEEFLNNASRMSAACRNGDPQNNPGALLGLLLGVCHKAGRDKLTIFTSPEVASLGAWLEQLVAESTGKNGVAIIPVDGEPKLDTAKYGDDRIFAFIATGHSMDFDKFAKDLQNAGHPTVSIEMPDVSRLAQEFFRWEFATAVAGAVMGINPFDQPDVESAKIEARKLTDTYEQTGALPGETPFYIEGNIGLYAGEQYASQLTAEANKLADILAAHIGNIRPDDYFALLAYLEMNTEHSTLLGHIRKAVLERCHAATCLGFGPRFLHSTGQAYKGGANNGVFLQITADDPFDLPVPGQKYTFGVVAASQARGDFEVLVDRGRRALRIHLGPDVKAGLELILSAVLP